MSTTPSTTAAAATTTTTTATGTTSATGATITVGATGTTPVTTATGAATATGTLPATPFATPLTPGGAPYATPLPSCLMPESFTGKGDFEDYLQQFNTAALLSSWYSATHDNRPYYFALRLRENALHFYTTLSIAQQTDFTQLVDAFRQNYTTNVDILKARLKAARQQPNQDISAFLCDIRTLARRAYRTFPHLIEQIVLTSFIEGLSDQTLRWELRKAKPATADDALALAMELNSFLEIEKGPPSKSDSTTETGINMISREGPEPSTKQMMEDFVRTLTEGIRNAMPKTTQSENRQRSPTPIRGSSRSGSNDSQRGKSVRFEKKGYSNNRNGQNQKQDSQGRYGNRFNRDNGGSKEPCRHCKRTNHESKDCKACYKCGRVGHFQRECRSQTPQNLN